MVFVWSSMVLADSQMLCEQDDVGYNCDFSKNSKKQEDRSENKKPRPSTNSLGCV